MYIYICLDVFLEENFLSSQLQKIPLVLAMTHRQAQLLNRHKASTAHEPVEL